MKTKFGPIRSHAFLYKSLFMHEIFLYIYIYIDVYISKEDIEKKFLNKRRAWLQCTHRTIEKHNQSYISHRDKHHVHSSEEQA